MIMLTRRKALLGLSFLFALIVSNVSGPQYIYPTFGTALDERFNWSAVQNSIVSTACFIGVSFSGPLCSWMIETLGIQKTLKISALLIFLGPFLVAQTYAGRLPDSFILCTFYFICMGFAGAAAYMCALDSQSHNFKHRRGLSMGLTTASVGTCGVVFSQINDLLFGSDRYDDTNVADDSTYHFLIFLAFTMATGIFLGSFFLGPIETEEDIVYESLDEEQFSNYVNTAANDNFSDYNTIVSESSRLLNEVDTLTNNSTPLKGDEEDIDEDEVVLAGLEFLKHPVGFGLFSTLFIVLGIGYVYLANIGHILNAITTESNQHVRNLHITLFSLGNCGSRAVFGALSDILKNKLGIHRLWIFVFASISMLCTLIYLVSVTAITPEGLIPCTIIVSSAYGIVFGVGPSATAEFGTEVFARNWGLLLFAPAFGSQIFNVLFGILYGNQAEKQGSHVCHGTECYTGTFRVSIICNALSLCILLMAIYKAGLYKRKVIHSPSKAI